MTYAPGIALMLVPGIALASGAHGACLTLASHPDGRPLAQVEAPGASASFTIRYVHSVTRTPVVERYRVVVRASGPWASMALVDVERLLCDKRGFRWSALEVWGSCRRDGELGEGAQARIDAKAKQIADARP